MGELISKLGVDWRLLFAQVVNFLLLFFLLQRFVYKPLGVFLKDRSRTIQRGLEDAKKAQEEREKVKIVKDQVVAKAQQEANDIIAKAQAKGQEEFDAVLEKAKARKEELVKEAKAQIEQEKEDALRSARVALGQLVISATQKVLEDTMDQEKDRIIIEKVLSQMK